MCYRHHQHHRRSHACPRQQHLRIAIALYRHRHGRRRTIMLRESAYHMWLLTTLTHLGGGGPYEPIITMATIFVIPRFITTNIINIRLTTTMYRRPHHPSPTRPHIP
jgi:hypothetical protein